MSHYRRSFIPGGVYFFTVVTHNRRPIFTDESHVEILRQALRKVIERRPFQIDAMVILPDHLHCIWRLPDGDVDYSSRWRDIKKAVSREIPSEANARGERQVWQRRFWEHVIRDEEDWRRHVDYIHYNPVKHGLVKTPGNWPWSSFRTAVEKGWYEASWGGSAPRSLQGMECE